MKRNRFRLTVCLLSLSAFIMSVGTACSKTAKGSDSAEEIEFLAPADSLSLPLPAPPATIADARDRADFIAFHFWDKMDFSDVTLLERDDFMEQNFANFLSVLAAASGAGSDKGVGALVRRATDASPQALERVMALADKYLREPNSPMNSETQYIQFLRNALSMSGVGEEFREQWHYRLERASMNAQGTRATDFAVRSRSGQNSQLLSLAPSADRRIVIFYDDECDNCAAVIKQMRSGKELSADIADGSTAVIAVNVTADPASFRGSEKIPAQWLDVIPLLPDGSSIDDLYDLPAMPVIYLLDPSGKVLQKDLRLSAGSNL